MNLDPRNTKWGAWLNIVAALITIVGLAGSLTNTAILGPLQKSLQIPVWAMLVLAIFVPSASIIVGRRLKKSSGDTLAVLHKVASHPDLLKIVDVTGREFIGGHASNFYWKEVAGALCTGLSRSDLRYSNLGSHYHLRDLATGKTIEIPIDKRLEEKVTNTGVKNGQILMVEQNR